MEKLRYKLNEHGVALIDVPFESVIECRGNNGEFYYEVHRLKADEYMVYVDFAPNTEKSEIITWGRFFDRYYKKGKNKGKLAQSARDAAWRSVD